MKLKNVLTKALSILLITTIMFNGVSPVSAIQTASATQTSFHYDMMDTLMSTLSDLQEFDDFAPDFTIGEDSFVREPIDIAVGMEFDFSDGIIDLSHKSTNVPENLLK